LELENIIHLSIFLYGLTAAGQGLFIFRWRHSE